MNPHTVTKDFERELCAYTGAPFAVAVNSCTAALLLAVAWHLRFRDPHGSAFHLHGPIIGDNHIEIPKRTYASVPMAIMHAGGRPTFRDEEWLGLYQLKPLPVYDCARLFTSGMYAGETLRCLPGFKTMGVQIPHPGDMLCVSFHASKTLGLEQGGAILHDDPDADIWFRKARFDGREEGVPPIEQQTWMVGWHAYMNPSTAAQGILKLHSLPRHNEPLENDPYPDLSTLEIFQ